MPRVPSLLSTRQSCASRSFSGRGVVRIAVWTIVVVQFGLTGANRLPAETVQSSNFEVTADCGATARLLAEQAEELRSQLSTEWLGSELPAWRHKCAIRVDTESVRLYGDTTYTLAPAGAMRWRMMLRGPLERVVETLLPHEVLHTILASHYEGAVPRWADEGAALSVEPEAEQLRLWAQSGRRLLRGPRKSLGELFACEQYPADRDEMVAFYAQGAAVTEFLLLAGKPQFLSFVRAGMQDGWEQAVVVHYGFADVASLEASWVDWLRDARPMVSLIDGQSLADAVGSRLPIPTLVAEVAPEPIGAASQPEVVRTVGSGLRSDP